MFKREWFGAVELKEKNWGDDMPNVQLSLFDMDFTLTKEKVTKNRVPFTKIPSLVVKVGQSFTKSLAENSKPKIEKVKKPLELTAEQQNFLNQNKIMENENLSRLILYAGNSLGIETLCKYAINADGTPYYKTIYLNREGKEEFTMQKTPVLPTDRIIYYKTDFEINEVQKQKLQEVKETYKGKIKRIIHRHGDENILVEVEGKLLDIIPKGWILEFTEATHVDCSQDEVLEDFQEEKKDAGQLVQPGDLVQATIGKSVVEGTITHTYGLGNAVLNIDFEKSGTMVSTAIPRSHVKAILGKSNCVFWQYAEDSIIYFCSKCKKILNNNDEKCSCGQEINWQIKAMCEDKIKIS